MAGLPDFADDDLGMDDDMFLGLGDLLPPSMAHPELPSFSASHSATAAFEASRAQVPQQEAWAPPDAGARRRRVAHGAETAEAAGRGAGSRRGGAGSTPGGDSDEDMSDEKPEADKVKDRRERNKASARASRKKRKALLEGLAGKVTSLAEQTDRERLARAETAASGVDRRRAELVASARAALAAAASSSIPDGGASDYLSRGSSAGTSEQAKQRRRQTASAAAAALPALLRERFSLAGSERRALIDFALEHSAATAMPHHLRVLAFMAEQRPEFFSTADQRVAGAEAAKARADAAFEASPALAGIASGSVSSLPAAADTERPDLWGILSNELWLSDAGSESLRGLMQSTGAASMAAMRDAVIANRRLRAAIAQRAEAAAALSASVHSVLTPAQELAFQDFLSRNAERIRTLMPAASRTRSTDAAAAETSRAAHGPGVAGLDGLAQARRAEEQLQAAVMIAREASGASLPEVACTPRAGSHLPPCTGPSY